MRLVFRPSTPLAAYLRKRAWDMAMAMKGRVQNRIEDGFLLQAVAMDDVVTVTVIDLPGIIYVPVEAHAGADDWYAGFSLHFDGNPTDALYAQGPVFQEQAVPRYVGPRRFATFDGGAPWGPGRITGSGATFTVHATGVYSARVSAPSGAVPVFCTIQRTRANSLFRDAPAALSLGALPADELIGTATGVGLFEVPLDEFDLDGASIQNWMAVAPLDAVSGYVVGVGRKNGTPSNAALGYDRLVIGRYALSDGDDDNPAASAVLQSVAAFDVGDLPTDDSPDALPVVDDVRPPGPGTWSIQSVDGAYDPDANGVYALQFSRPTAIDAEVQWLAVGYVLDQPKQFAWPDPVVIGCRGGLTMMVTAVTRRDVERVPATLVNSITAATASVELVDRMGAEQRVSYIARVEPNGSKSLTRVEKSIVATHDPRWRGELQVEHYPLHADIVNDQPYFACIRREVASGVLEPVGAGVANYYRPTPITRPSDISFVLVNEAGEQVTAALNGFYPVYFAIMDGRASEIANQFVGGDDARLNYGQRPTYNLFPGAPVEFSKPSPVCRYGDGLCAVVVAPASGFVEADQIARIAVIDARTGALFAMSPPILPFHIEGTVRNGEVQRWHLSCVEEAVLDDDGQLLRHATLLALRSARTSASQLYRIDNLEQVVEVGGAISTAGGPAVYLGTPLRPADVGRSTGLRTIGREIEQ